MKRHKKTKEKKRDLLYIELDLFRPSNQIWPIEAECWELSLTKVYSFWHSLFY